MRRAATLLLLTVVLTAEGSYCPWWPAVEKWGVPPREIEQRGNFRRHGIQFIQSPEGWGTTELRGTDTAGRPWRLRMYPHGMGSQSLFAADFDKNGREDYVFTDYTGAVGMARPTWIIFVMIDSSGRPVPMLRRSYDDPRHLRFSDFNRDGRLEWTYTSYGASNRDRHHYWTSMLYEARDAHWHPVIGTHGNIVSPQFTQFTNDANRRPFPLTEAQKPPVTNIGSAPSFAEPLTIQNWTPGQDRSPPQRRQEGTADYYFRIETTRAPKLLLSNGETCFLGNDVETILDQGGTLSWVEQPTRPTLSKHPLQLTVTRHRDICRIERIVIAKSR